MNKRIAGIHDRPGNSALLLTAFALVSAMPVVPPSWGWPIAGAVLVVAIVVAALRDREAAALALFCAIMPVVAMVNLWQFWPMGFLVPLLSYGLVLGTIPPLRRAVTWPGWGRFDRWTIGLMAVTVVGSSSALVLWYTIAQPDVSDFRRLIPAWPLWAMPLAGLGFSVVNAFIEEVIWRGILWALLFRAVPIAWVVVFLQAVSFGLIHLHGFPRGWVGVGLAALYGVFLGWVRHRGGGLGPPILAHIFADVTIFVILVLTMAG